MTEVANRRLVNQRIVGAGGSSAAEVVAHMGAMQAQDYRNALWAIGLRVRGSAERSIEQAIAAKEVVRTWPMRGTLHFLAATDVHWILELLTPRVLAAAEKRAAVHGLNAATFERCRGVCIAALSGGRQMMREALLREFEAAGVATEQQRGYHILWRLAHERLICFGVHEGNQPTFALLDDWVAANTRWKPGDPLAELARRYFNSHGPATLQDFVWWCGLKVSDARNAIEVARLPSEQIDETTHWSSTAAPFAAPERSSAQLLPAFDEYLLGYGDRTAVLDSAYAARVVPGGNGMFLPTVVVNGRVVGTWKRSLKKKSVTVTVSPFDGLATAAKKAVAEAAEYYAAFVELRLELVLA